MKKRLLSLLLALVMVLSLMPSVALAAGEEGQPIQIVEGEATQTSVIEAVALAPVAETSPDMEEAPNLNSGEYVCEIGDTSYETIAAALEHGGTDASTVPNGETGSSPTTIRLLGNVAENVTIPTGRNITLDLNGHVLKGTGTNINKASVIVNNGTLKVKDTATDNNTHYYTVQEGGLWKWDDGNTAGAVALSSLSGYPASNTVIAVTGGCITGGTGTNNYGGGIQNKGALSVENVNIIGNRALSGGGIFSRDARCSVSGGTICGNIGEEAALRYFNVNSTEPCVMKGVKVLANTSDKRNVDIENAKCTMEDCEIRFNRGMGMRLYDHASLLLGGSTVICDNTTIENRVEVETNLMTVVSSYLSFSTGTDACALPAADMKVGVHYEEVGYDSVLTLPDQTEDHSGYIFSDSMQYYVALEDSALVIKNRITQQPSDSNNFEVKVTTSDLTNPVVTYQWGKFNDNITTYGAMASDTDGFFECGASVTSATPAEGDGEDLTFVVHEGYTFIITYSGSLVSAGDYVTFSTNFPPYINPDDEEGCLVTALGDNQYQMVFVAGEEGTIATSFSADGENYNDALFRGDYSDFSFDPEADECSMTLHNFTVHHITQEDIPSETASKLSARESGTYYRCAITINGKTIYSDKVKAETTATTKHTDNVITGTLTCADITVGGKPAPTGVTAKYGNDKLTYLYSADGKAHWRPWNKSYQGAGTYYVKAVVEDCEDYNGAESNVATFRVKNKTASHHSGGSSATSYTITSDLKTITKVTVDGKTVDSKYYTVSGGNVTLTQAYLNTLSNGSHTVKLYNGDKVATATITVKNNTVVKSAKTGDIGVGLYGVMAIASLLGSGIVAGKKRKKI